MPRRHYPFIETPSRRANGMPRGRPRLEQPDEGSDSYFSSVYAGGNSANMGSRRTDGRGHQDRSDRDHNIDRYAATHERINAMGGLEQAFQQRFGVQPRGDDRDEPSESEYYGRHGTERAHGAHDGRYAEADDGGRQQRIEARRLAREAEYAAEDSEERMPSSRGYGGRGAHGRDYDYDDPYISSSAAQAYRGHGSGNGTRRGEYEGYPQDDGGGYEGYEGSASPGYEDRGRRTRRNW